MSYAEIRGVRLHYVEAGTGKPLILLHGNAGSARVWRKVMPALGRRYRVIAHDRQGFGGSDKSEPADPSPAGYARELRALMDALGIARAHVVGLSLGGMIAQRFALDFPGRVEGLVLVGTTADRTGRPVAETLTALARDGWTVVANRLVRSWFRPESDPADVREAYEIAIQSSQQLREATVRALGTFDIRDEIGRIAAPTLVVVGRDDRTCPEEHAEVIAARIPSARMVVLPDCAHLVPVEQPERFTEVVSDFLAGVDSDRRSAGAGPGGHGRGP